MNVAAVVVVAVVAVVWVFRLQEWLLFVLLLLTQCRRIARHRGGGAPEVGEEKTKQKTNSMVAFRQPPSCSDSWVLTLVMALLALLLSRALAP